jgi:hypothetical protein
VSSGKARAPPFSGVLAWAHSFSLNTCFWLTCSNSLSVLWVSQIGNVVLAPLAQPVPFFRLRLSPERTSIRPKSHSNPLVEPGPIGKGLISPCGQQLYTFCKFEKAEGKACWASWRQVALLKPGLVVASLTSFPWKQSAGQLVPINLSLVEPQPLTGPRSWPARWLTGGGTPAPCWSLTPPPLLGSKQKVSKLLVPTCLCPQT